MARSLNTAYGDGLLSEATLAHRLEELFGSAVIDPARLVGDLTIRPPRRALAEALRTTIASARRIAGVDDQSRPGAVLALDWTGAQDELLVGRRDDCDVVLTGLTVSRRHARLRFRDGRWILHDLESTNGTRVNGRPVIRCQLLPGDRVMLGDESLLVD
ncbi:MAG: FHA domain-containing protein [Solirubrobacteraceae bacterium]